MNKNDKKIIYLTKKDIENIVEKGKANILYNLENNNYEYNTDFGQDIDDTVTYDENTFVKIDEDDMVSVFEQNWGDGNEWYKTFHFPNWGFYVSIEGTYSSYEESSWNSIYYSEPYEHTETRYKKKGK